MNSPQSPSVVDLNFVFMFSQRMAIYRANCESPAKALLLWASRDLGVNTLITSTIAGNAKWRCTRSLAAISEPPPYGGPSVNQRPPGFGQQMRISGGTNAAGVFYDECRVSHVGHDARRSTGHGLADHNRKGFATRGRGGNIHSEKRREISWRNPNR